MAVALLGEVERRSTSSKTGENLRGCARACWGTITSWGR